MNDGTTLPRGSLSARRWYLAVCADCKPVLPQPFTNEQERDTWAKTHANGTGHTVRLEEVWR